MLDVEKVGINSFQSQNFFNSYLYKLRVLFCFVILSTVVFPSFVFSEKLSTCTDFASTLANEKTFPVMVRNDISSLIVAVPSFNIVYNSPQEASQIIAGSTATSAQIVKKSVKINSIHRVKGVGKKLSITFDGGWSDSSAVEILDVLKKKEITTTFFLAGSFIQKFPDLVQRIVADGHEVGNHTLTHLHLTTYSEDRKHETAEGMSFDILKHELEETARLFKSVTGMNMIPYWRAPYGEINEDILSWATKIGYQHVHWTVDYKAKRSMDSLDWVADKSSSLYLTTEQIKKRLLAFADQKESASGGIILMHLGTEREEDILHERLEDIIESFQAKGYEMVPFSNLIKMKTPG